MCETIIACAIAASRLRALQYDEETKGRRRAYGYSHRSEVGRTAVPADTQPDHRGHRLVPGTALPSVRALASDLGINLHTVNKAYAVLRDEGYVLMRGRSGAYIADPCEDDRADRAQIELAKMEDGLFELALAHRARGGTWGEFLECAQRQAARAYGAGERSDARTAQASRDAQGENIERAASCEPAFKGGAL